MFSKSPREEFGMGNWRDKELAQQLAKCLTEHSVVMQLATVSAEDGTVFGLELLLTDSDPASRPESYIHDPMLSAMLDETRARIAQRVQAGEYRNG